MLKLIPTRTKALILAIALAVPSAAQAGPKDEVYAVAAAIRAAGEASRAAELEVLAAAMSDEDAQRLVDAGIARVTAGFREVAGQRAQAERQGVPLSSAQDLNRGVTRSAGLPDPDYPDPAQCVNSPNGSDFDTLFGTFTAVTTARAVVNSAQEVMDGLEFVCLTVVVAIGVGGNPQNVACIAAQIILIAAEIILNGAEAALAIVQFCDDEISGAESAATFERTEHIHNDLEAARVEILARLQTHDDDIKAILAMVLAQLTVIENKVDLGLKSQAEIAMHTKQRTRPSVFYEERLDEICGYAQEAIDDLPVVYLAASAAQAILDRAVQFKVTDPKRAADECIKAFLQATVRSDAIQ